MSKETFGCFILMCLLWGATFAFAAISDADQKKNVIQLSKEIEQLKESQKQADYRLELCRKQLGHRSEQ